MVLLQLEDQEFQALLTASPWFFKPNAFREGSFPLTISNPIPPYSVSLEQVNHLQLQWIATKVFLPGK